MPDPKVAQIDILFYMLLHHNEEVLTMSNKLLMHENC